MAKHPSTSSHSKASQYRGAAHTARANPYGGQELGKLFHQAQALGDPIKQLQNVGKMLKSSD